MVRATEQKKTSHALGRWCIVCGPFSASLRSTLFWVTSRSTFIACIFIQQLGSCNAFVAVRRFYAGQLGCVISWGRWVSTTDVLSENISLRAKSKLSRSVSFLWLNLPRVCITFTFCLVELQPKFTAVPPNPFTVLEGNNISLEWSYDLAGESLDRVEFVDATSSPSIRILEVNTIGQTPKRLLDDYIGRLQVNVTVNHTSITIFGANRTVDSKEYEFEVAPSVSSVVPSLVRISVQCKYKSRSVFTFQFTGIVRTCFKDTFGLYFLLVH